ncbi:MAG: hypothetical protein AAF985_18945 [Bacteroidota bacterium]
MSAKNYLFLSLICLFLNLACSPDEPISEEPPIENKEPSDPIDLNVNCQFFFGAWCMEYIEAPEIGTEFHRFFFIDDLTGYRASRYGVIAKTVDGGVSWQLINHQDLPSPITTEYLGPIFFIDKDHGYIGQNCCYGNANFGPILLKTMDGGTTWEKYYMEEMKGFDDLLFFDEHNGLAIALVDIGEPLGERQVMRTTDGGLSWSKIDLPVSRLRTVSFLRVGGNINLLSEEGTGQSIILRSTDEGQSWLEVPLPEPDCHRIHFINEQFGFATFGERKFTEYVYETRDGGQTWEMKDHPIRYDSFIHFHDPDNGFVINTTYDYEWVSSGVYAVGNGRVLYHTTDGGATWSRATEEEGYEFGQFLVHQTERLVYTHGYEYFSKFAFQ